MFEEEHLEPQESGEEESRLSDRDALKVDLYFWLQALVMEGQPIVKRVIAVGGQTVDIDYESNTVYVDGVVLDEPYILEPMRELPSNFATHVVVPEGSIFVMGDNRNNSTDGRSPELGVVDERCVLGRALFVLLPFQDIGPVESISRPA